MSEVKTQSQKTNEALLEKARPQIAKGKRTNHLPNPDLFSREKTITANKQVKQTPADWRKFVIGATPVVLVKGMGITETEYNLIKKQGPEAVKYFLSDKK